MRNDDNRAKAFYAFQRAAELDPNFAEAWAAVVNVGIFSKGSPLARDKENFSRTVNQALSRALAIDPNNVTALTSGAYWRLNEQLDIAGARELLLRVEKIDPKQAAFGYAGYWLKVGEPDKAIEVYEKMAALDPLNYSFRRSVADVYSTMGRHDDALKFYNECQAINCLREGFIAFGSTVVLLSGNEAEITRWHELWKQFSAFIKFLPQSELPQVVRVVPAYFATLFGEPEADQLQQDMIEMFKTDPVTDTIGQWGPTFARFLPADLMMDTLELAYERGDLFGASFDLMPFYGQDNYPDEILAHPRYLALWEKPGLKELETLRRANGYTDGLPIRNRQEAD